MRAVRRHPACVIITRVQHPMKELLSQLIDKEVDVVCTGTSSLRGKVVKIDGDVLHLKDEDDNVCYVAIDKITAVWEKRDKDRHPGFIFKS